MGPVSPMSSSDPCAHDDARTMVCGDARGTSGRDRPRARVRRVFWITLVLNAVVAVSKASYGYITGSVALGTDSRPLDPRRRVERAGAARPALVGRARRRAPPLRPPQARDPRRARHRRADRDRPVRAGRGRRGLVARAPPSATDRMAGLRGGDRHHGHQLLRDPLRAPQGARAVSHLLCADAAPHEIRPLRVGGGAAVVSGRPKWVRLGRRRGRPDPGRAGRAAPPGWSSARTSPCCSMPRSSIPRASSIWPGVSMASRTCTGFARAGCAARSSWTCTCRSHPTSA